MSARRGVWSDALRRLLASRAAVASLVTLTALCVLALAGPSLSRYAPDELDWAMMGVPPDWVSGHWLGTDRLGRDLFVRTLHGARISLVIALFATLVSLLIGVTWGAVAGYAGGRTDALMMRFVDVLYALPGIFFVIVLTVVFDRSPLLLFLAIGAVGWLTMARVVRGQAIGLMRREFVEAAVAAGAGPARVVFRHLVPNLAGTVVVYATLMIPQMILVESFLSFLGIGIQEPLASLGNLIADGAAEMEIAPWILLAPAGCLVIIVLCFNFLGDGLRDALDPRER
ncbi:MAG: oligopeptide transporter permease protein [Proteobacteria bacterium]|nr:oligopeptide transporter permease protein [Pseudomonadota bacterium]